MVVVNVTDPPPAIVPVTTDVPTAVPAVYVIVAFPVALVIEEAALSVPPPETTVHVTVDPATETPSASATRTVNAAAGVLTRTDCAAPLTTDNTFVAASTVELNVTGVRPGPVAVTVAVPAVAPAV